MSREPRVLIIGAGVAGIATAVRLERAGFRELTILEKGADVRTEADWSSIFAPGEEIQRYVRDVADRFGLEGRVRLNAEVVSAEFTGAGWHVATADGTRWEADFVIAATGVLHHPYTPPIPGLDTFGGDLVHTARWDDRVEVRSRRIGVIGNGSTGVQIVSALQRRSLISSAPRSG